MKQNINLLLIAVLIVIVTTVSVAFFFNNKKMTVEKASLSKQFANDSFKVRPLTNIKYEVTPQRLKQGKYLTEGILQCFTCHSPRNWDAPGAPPIAEKMGSGGTILNEDSSTLVIAPNITPDIETGAGTWTDDMLGRAIREGVGHDGRALNWKMPATTFRSVSDEDLASIIVYLRSIPAVHHHVAPTKMTAAERLAQEKSLEPLTEPIAIPDLSDPMKRGRYLVKIGECLGCHTSHATYNPGVFAGGNDIERFGRIAFSANITADSTGIAYGPQAFIFTLRTGKGGLLSPIMPWISYKNMTDEDLKAVYTYLCAQPKGKHAISNLDPKTHCAICEQEHGLGEKNKREKPAGIKFDPALYDQYAGTYLNERYNWLQTVVRDGSRLIYIPWENAPTTELVPQSELHFLAPGYPVSINFAKDGNGKIVQLAEALDDGLIFKKIK
jgi:mono/diheme cytochrome c family protein